MQLGRPLSVALLVAGRAWADGAVESGPAAVKLGEQDRAFKMSPHDKAFGERIDDTDKFSAPKKAPMDGNAGKEAGSSADNKASSDENSPVILNDYDPNRLGVPAGDEEPARGAKDPEATSTATHAVQPSADPKAGLGTGKAEKGSGGIGASPAGPERGDSNAGTQYAVDVGADSGLGTFHGMTRIVAAASMILLSEIGDKTFFIAALMAMRHPHLFVFSSSFGAMFVMTVLSAILGVVLPTLLSKKVTTLLASLLFLFFGAKLLREGLSMDPSMGAQEEMHEVEQEIQDKETVVTQDKLEKGGDPGTGYSAATAIEGVRNLAGLVISPLWVQIFLMTFLGEWGDRSQIATVAMSASGDYMEVIIGGIIGHAIAIAIAVASGKLLATQLSMRTMTLSGSVCFLLFSLLYAYEWFRGVDE